MLAAGECFMLIKTPLHLNGLAASRNPGMSKTEKLHLNGLAASQIQLCAKGKNFPDTEIQTRAKDTKLKSLI